MKNSLVPFTLLLSGFFIFSCAVQRERTDEGLDTSKATTSAATKVSENGTKDQGHKTANQSLSESPRHHEWVTLIHGNRELQAFVVFPETADPAKSVIVIHENRGLNDWARLFTDKLAAEGFLVIAPDLISNTNENKRTTDFENADTARDAIYSLAPKQITLDLDAAFEYVKTDPSTIGEVAVVGLCWGGSQAFRYASTNSEITSAHVFFATGPEDKQVLAQISTPV